MGVHMANHPLKSRDFYRKLWHKNLPPFYATIWLMKCDCYLKALELRMNWELAPKAGHIKAGRPHVNFGMKLASQT